jgi:hypothetical protein
MPVVGRRQLIDCGDLNDIAAQYTHREHIAKQDRLIKRQSGQCLTTGHLVPCMPARTGSISISSDLSAN